MNKDDITKDEMFVASIIVNICDYSRENDLNPTDTVKQIGENLIAITEIASFDNWGEKDE